MFLWNLIWGETLNVGMKMTWMFQMCKNKRPVAASLPVETQNSNLLAGFVVGCSMTRSSGWVMANNLWQKQLETGMFLLQMANNSEICEGKPCDWPVTSAGIPWVLFLQTAVRELYFVKGCIWTCVRPLDISLSSVDTHHPNFHFRDSLGLCLWQVVKSTWHVHIPHQATWWRACLSIWCNVLKRSLSEAAAADGLWCLHSSWP